MLFKKIIYLVLERGEWRGEERERNIHVQEKHQLVASRTPPVGDPGVCPERESNWQPFGLQADAQSTEPHQAGLIFNSYMKYIHRSIINL